MKTYPLITIAVPVFNEVHTIAAVLNRLAELEMNNMKKEIIVVDDASTDGSASVVENWLIHRNPDEVYFFYLIRHEKNYGKGKAIRTALQHAQGDYFIVQDADLELDPNDIKKLVQCALEHEGFSIFGRRPELKTLQEKLGFYALGNWFLNLIAKLLFRSSLNDFNVCYKLTATDLLQSLRLRSNEFEIEAEITAKFLKKKIPIMEIPISYVPRSISEGKKIRIRHAFRYLFTFFKIWLGRE